MTYHWEQLQQGKPVFDSFGEVYGFGDRLDFDKYKFQYVLTKDAVRNELNVDVEVLRGDSENADVFLKEISDIVYSYIYKKKPAVLRDKTEYYLTFDLRNRRILYYSMIDMIRYSLYGGGNIISYQPGVNLNESGLIDIEKLRDERIVSYVVDSILKTNMLVDRNFVDYFELPEVDWRSQVKEE